MFFFGLILGVLVAAMAVACWASRGGWLGSLTPYSARQTIWDIERRTMHELLAAELAAQRADSIDGTAVEEERPS
jgi:hypothetical protein